MIEETHEDANVRLTTSSMTGEPINSLNDVTPSVPNLENANENVSNSIASRESSHNDENSDDGSDQRQGEVENASDQATSILRPPDSPHGDTAATPDGHTPDGSPGTSPVYLIDRENETRSHVPGSRTNSSGGFSPGPLGSPAPSSPPSNAPTSPYGSPSPPQPPRSLTASTMGCLSRLEPVFSVITYPIMVIITVITLILVLTFCIFPTLLCMMLGICLYYCLREDPIPLSVLLRYMLSPDGDDHPEYPNSYALAQRPVIASKLIVRRLLKIEELCGEDEACKKETDYPRRHPFPIKVSTDRMCLHFSEPVTIEDDENQNLDNSTNFANHGDLQDDTNTSPHVPHYQRLENNPHNPPSPQSPSEDVPGAMVNGVSGDENDRGSSNDMSNASLEVDDVELGRNSDPKSGACGLQDAEIGNETDELEAQMVSPEALETIAVASGASDDHEKSGDYFGIEADARDRGTTCDICLLEYQVGDTVAWSPNLECSHAFHRDCVLDWLVRKPSCPNCRVDYLKGKHEENI